MIGFAVRGYCPMLGVGCLYLTTRYVVLEQLGDGYVLPRSAIGLVIAIAVIVVVVGVEARY